MRTSTIRDVAHWELVHRPHYLDHPCVLEVLQEPSLVALGFVKVTVDNLLVHIREVGRLLCVRGCLVHDWLALGRLSFIQVCMHKLAPAEDEGLALYLFGLLNSNPLFKIFENILEVSSRNLGFVRYFLPFR